MFTVIAGLALAAIFIGAAYWVKYAPPPAGGPKVEVKTTPVTDNPRAFIATPKGTIVLELFPANAPKTAANFIKLAQEKFYDGTTFHRVVAGFVIQGGDPLSKDPKTRDKAGTGGPGYTFADEINPKSIGVADADITALEAQGYKYDASLQSLPMTVGALAMANSGPNTNGSQFFIVTDQDQPQLNGKHTVFGKVISGLDVAKKISPGDVITSVTIEEKAGN